MLSILLSLGIKLFIYILHKTGFLDTAQAVAVKTGYTILHDVEGLKIYKQYPTGKNGATETN